MSVNSPKSPPSVQPHSEPGPQHPDEAEADIESLFDPGPAARNSGEKTDFIRSAIDAISKAWADAGAWVRAVLARLGIGQEAVRHVASQVTRVDHPLPGTPVQPEMRYEQGAGPREANGMLQVPLQTDMSDDPLGGELQAARQDFVEAKESWRKDQPLTPAAHKEAFDQYVRLCKRNHVAPGSIDCPQNFRDGAILHAKAFTELVTRRRQWADHTGTEFWLRPADQQAYRDATRFLDLQVGNTPENALRPFEPIPTHSAHQLLSFHAWRNRDQPSHDGLGNDASEPTIDAAINYAETMIALHAGTEQARQGELKDLVDSAYELLGNEALYRLTFNRKQDIDAMLSALGDFDRTEARPDARQLGKQAGTSVAGKASNAGAEVGHAGRHGHASTATRTDEPTPASTPSAATVLPAPSVLPPSLGQPLPTPQTPQARQPEQLDAIPDLSALDEVLQARATTLLNEFFRLYEQKIDREGADFNADPAYFSQLSAAAAHAFRKAVDAPDYPWTESDIHRIAAANRIIREYENQLKPQSRPRS